MSAAPVAAEVSRAGALRAAFDAGFAAPLPPPPPPLLALLLVSAGGRQVALERTQIGGLARAENIAPTPSRAAAFLGLVALRGQLHPVWSLGRLLGAGGPAAEAERWLIFTAGADGRRCALACAAVGQSLTVPEGTLVAPVRRAGEAAFIRAMLPHEAALLPVLDLPALQATFHPDSRLSPPLP